MVSCVDVLIGILLIIWIGLGLLESFFAVYGDGLGLGFIGI
jgi:hypothetical protein